MKKGLINTIAVATCIVGMILGVGVLYLTLSKLSSMEIVMFVLVTGIALFHIADYADRK